MKKNILLCIFLSLGTLTAWAQEQTSLLPTNEMKGIITGTPQEKIKDTNVHRFSNNANSRKVRLRLPYLIMKAHSYK